MIIEHDQIIEAVHAHTALMALGSRHREEAEIPAILHTDHSAALLRVARDAAPVVALRFAPAGVLSITNDPAAGALAVELAAETEESETLRQLILQAIKAMVLQIAYSAAGLPAIAFAREMELAASQAVAAQPTRIKIPRWI